MIRFEERSQAIIRGRSANDEKGHTGDKVEAGPREVSPTNEEMKSGWRRYGRVRSRRIRRLERGEEASHQVVVPRNSNILAGAREVRCDKGRESWTYFRPI